MHFHKFSLLLILFIYCMCKRREHIFIFIAWQLYSYQLPGRVSQIANNLEVLPLPPLTFSYISFAGAKSASCSLGKT